MTYSGRTTLHIHKFKNWKENPVPEDAVKAVRKVYILDAQWSTCPVEVENQVKDLWTFAELGNDKFVYITSINHLEGQLKYDPEKNFPLVDKWIKEEGNIGGEWKEVPLDVSLIVQYLREQGVKDDEPVWIHWWW